MSILNTLGVVYLLARRGQHSTVCGSKAVRRAAGETETPSMQNTATKKECRREVTFF